MKFSRLSSFVKKHPRAFFWLSALVINSITFLIIHYKIRPTAEPMALHYNVIVGVDMLGAGTNLYRIPFIGGLLLAVNFIISRLVKSPENFLAFLASFVSFAVAVFLLVAVLFVLRVN